VDPASPKGNVEAPERRFSLRQSCALAIVSFVGYLVIRALGTTLRFAWSEEDGATPERIARLRFTLFCISAFFQQPALFRGQGIAVMTSLSFDGEFIARIIEKLGFARCGDRAAGAQWARC